ncbi:MAG: hypothetical protein LAP21_15975 [Acidobacteriia bacterium]|nr:hypothetical protein [Terriglobia bacterium]
MACRIHNLGKHRLAVDLRGGGVMYVQPNQISPPVREELLYDNVHLPAWEAQGLVRRIDAKMSEVLEHEGRKPVAAAKPKASAKPAKAADEDDDGNEAGDEEEKVEKKPRKTSK